MQYNNNENIVVCWITKNIQEEFLSYTLKSTYI